MTRQELNFDNERGIESKLEIEDIEPMDVDTTLIEELTENFDVKNPLEGVLNDYSYLRKKVLFNIEACSSILDYAMRNIKLNLGPKEIDSCGSIIKVQNDSAQELLKIHENIKKISSLLKPTETRPKVGDDDSNIVVDATMKDIMEKAEKAQAAIDKEKV